MNNNLDRTVITTKTEKDNPELFARYFKQFKKKLDYLEQRGPGKTARQKRWEREQAAKEEDAYPPRYTFDNTSKEYGDAA